LVQTVKAFAAQEEDVFVGVTEARAKATNTTVNLDDPSSVADFQAAQGEVTSTLSRLLVTVEAYPELKSDQNFLELQAQLEGTENRIAVERGRYNETVKGFNIKVRRFPTNLIAGVFNFAIRTMFESDAGTEDAPAVDFGE